MPERRYRSQSEKTPFDRLMARFAQSRLGGLLFMNLTGRMVEAFSYSTIFIIMGFLHPAAYLVCRLMVPGTPATTQQPAQQSLAEYVRSRK